MPSILALRIVFGAIFLALLAGTSWAGFHQPVWEWGGLTQPPDNGWTIATLLDAYAGFITFFVWVYYKETRPWKRWAWFIAIMGLGNMAMSVYVLRELARLPAGEPASSVLTRRNA